MSVADGLDRDIQELPDGDFLGLIARETHRRESLSSVRDALLTLLASGPALSTSIGSVAASDMVAASVARGRVEASARQALFDHPHLEAGDVADVVGSRDKNRRNVARRLRDRGDIIGYELSGRYLYPAFQFDAATGRVRPIVVEVNHLLDAKEDPWAVASWWLSPTGWLSDGTSPADLAAQGGRVDQIRAIANDLVAR